MVDTYTLPFILAFILMVPLLLVVSIIILTMPDDDVENIHWKHEYILLCTLLGVDTHDTPITQHEIMFIIGVLEDDRKRLKELS